MGRASLPMSALLIGLCMAGSALAASPLLTTKAQSGGPTIIVDGSGKEVVFKGIGWYGFNLGFAAPELGDGTDALSKDFKQVVYRQKQLGFNSIRLAFTFDDVLGIRSPIVKYATNCTVPSTNDIQSSLRPPASTYAGYSVPAGWTPTDTPPAVNKSICNSDMPNDSTYNRFIWMVNYYISQGFYVNLDYHSNMNQDVGAKKNQSFADQGAWINNWKILLTDLQKTSANKGKILVDLINEPDGYNLTWQGTGAANSSLTSYYVNAIDALSPVCPDCLWLIEGGGQYHWCGINWGNGFMTDQDTIKNNPDYNISDATPFLNAIIGKSWLNQVVLAPHIYCPGVTSAVMCYSGQELYDGLDKSFGYLTVSPGWCNNGNCRVFPVILDEFGSTLNNTQELTCMKSIEAYANGINGASLTKHAPLKSWFFWAWQPDSYGTGGLVGDDWKTIMWSKIGALSGNTADFATGFGLTPWYLAKGFSALDKTSSGGTAVSG